MSKSDAFFYGILVGIILILVGVALGNYFVPAPQAIDVYQGKTTLEYKVVDGIKTDSTVIWRK